MECLANITKALGDKVSPRIKSLLEPLFSNGLSEQASRDTGFIAEIRCFVPVVNLHLLLLFSVAGAARCPSLKQDNIYYHRASIWGPIFVVQ